MDEVAEKLKDVILKQKRLLELKVPPQQPKPISREKISPSVKTPLGK